MPELENIARAVRTRLDKKNSAREDALRISRKVIRECRSAMSSVHGGGDPKGNLDDARKTYEQLKMKLADFPDLLSAGYVIDAGQELAETEILVATAGGKRLPTPDEIGVPDEPFILGMADSVGELRRLFLDALMKDNVKGAERMLGKMEDFFAVLMTFDYPDALVATKRKQDVARSLIEKSRGELAMAAQMSQLRKRLK